MKANQANLLSLLNKPQQFIIPIYQRPYSWREKQCDQLFRDVLRISNDQNSSGHFIGSIVYFQESIYTSTTIPKYLVIDGQQRLTTIALLIKALHKVINENELDLEITAKKLANYYLVNPEEENLEKYKLLLTRKDKDTLIDIIEDRDIDYTSNASIVRNFHFFEERITKDNAKAIIDGMQKLIIVDVALEYGKDNPQLIFESLNSTGLDLTQADLIRNYILMDLQPEKQKEIYDRYWFPMENAFGEKYTNWFDLFVRDYLTYKSGSIPRIDEIYEEFKKHVEDNGKSIEIESITSDLFKYAKFYVQFALHQESDRELRRLFTNLTALRVNVSYPFLLFLYDKYTEGAISLSEMKEIVRYIESYVYRRAIVGIPTNSLNKTFATFKKYVDKEDFVNSVLAHFLLLETYRRFPKEDEFKESFSSKDLYNTRSIKYTLDRLENFNRKETVNVDEFTIEHIMPQNPELSKDWKTMLGENWKNIQEKYLHTIGNLTLTGYNSELSDKPFKDKHEMEGGFADSPIRLNEILSKTDRWDESAIIGRANRIADKATKVWKLPYVEEYKLKKYRYKRLKSSSRIPNNLNELIENESRITPAASHTGYVRFKPNYLLGLKPKLVKTGLIPDDFDLLKEYLFWYEFTIGTDNIGFKFLIGQYYDQSVRRRIYEVFTRFTHYFPEVDKSLRKKWHTVYFREIISNEEYELHSDEENYDLVELIEERFREVIDVDIPKINQALDALIESI